jgi:hypothetical protein
MILDHTQYHIAVGRTPLYEGSALLRKPYLSIHNTHTRQTPMTSAEFEPATPASERPHDQVLDLSISRPNLLNRKKNRYVNIVLQRLSLYMI